MPVINERHGHNRQPFEGSDVASESIGVSDPVEQVLLPITTRTRLESPKVKTLHS